MEKKTEKWRSPSLGKDMTVTVYGDSGTPILGLPTRGKDSSQWEKQGMTEAISLQLEKGFNRLFCVESVTKESFLNEKIEPRQRVLRQQQYELYIIEEVVPFIRKQSSIDYLIIAGVDMGAYQAVNLALKHPKEFGRAIGMSGIYDIKRFMDDYYDDNVYYNNPVDYLPNLNKQPLLDRVRKVDYRIVSYQQDARKGEAERMAQVMRMKFVEHKLDIWNVDETDEWELWPQMLKAHII